MTTAVADLRARPDLRCAVRSGLIVYVGRGMPRLGVPGHPLANPYRAGTATAAEHARVVAEYRDWLLSRPDLLGQVPALRGRVLGCWCTPLPCHGHVLADLADSGAR